MRITAIYSEQAVDVWMRHFSGQYQHEIAAGGSDTAPNFLEDRNDPSCFRLRHPQEEMQGLIEADIDCTNAAQLLMRMQADLVMFVEKRERLKSPVERKGMIDVS